MCRSSRLVSILFACFTILPAAVYAQASITGIVRDTSGGALPGVTVEAASPVLIEKVRSVVTDGSGQYRIEDLRPGAYTVTYTLAGFATLKREGIQLTGSFTASVNVEMRVGALEETITVTGETPTVDVQSTLRQRVFDREVLDALPSGGHPGFMAALIPGVTTDAQDVGGIRGMGRQGNLSVHGSLDVRTTVSGVSIHSSSSGNSGISNMAVFAEMAVDTGAISAEQKEGGLRMNMIPRDGGNTPSGSFVAAFANDSMAWDNVSQELRDRGLQAPDALKKIWDVNPAFGGPLKKDTLWYHVTMRYTGAQNYANQFFNKNAGNANAWTYEPDIARGPAWTDNVWKHANARLTWQATPRNKFAVAYDFSDECACPRSLALTPQIAPEAIVNQLLRPKRMLFGNWTAPLTNRLLFEAVVLKHDEYASRPPEQFPKVISVLEQSTNLRYRAPSGGSNDFRFTTRTFLPRVTMSYVTGAHALKIGFNYGKESQEQLWYGPVSAPINFRFNNGVPNRLTLRAFPYTQNTNIDADHGLFVQDRWTVNRLTMTAGLRYDYFHNSYPDAAVGPGQFVPIGFALAGEEGFTWHDLSPRTGLVVDVFGDGKTAAKVSVNRYLAPQHSTGPLGRDAGPGNRISHTTNRSWNDANRNFVPDCALLNPAANGECGAMDNPDFGSRRRGLTFDPELSGWSKRSNNWEFSAGVQHELLPRVSMDASYFRRWFGNFLVTQNRAFGPGDFDEFSITAPADPRLPDGGGYAISGLYDLKPGAFGRPDDGFVTLSDNYGKQIEHWNGVDVTLNARPRPGLVLQGGTSTGRTTRDNCEVVTQVGGPPGSEGALAPYNPSQLYCHYQDPFRTQIKFLGTYTVPRIDLQLTATLQNNPGPEIAANFTATNAVVSRSLGRNLAGGANNVTVNLVAPGTIYGDRLNQIDLRVAKILRFGRVRATANVDLYNVMNANTVLRENSAFAVWRRPDLILTARFAKLGVQFDF